MNLLLARTGSNAKRRSVSSAIRPYDANSAWNSLIGGSPTIDSLNATYMTAISDNGLALTSDHSQFTLPIWLWDASTPTYTVVGDGFFRQYTTNDQTNSTGSGSPWSIPNVPIPNGAIASPGSDGQIILWNPTTGEQYNFWQFASDIAQNPLAGHYYASNGNHCSTAAGNKGTFLDGLSGRGAGTSYMAGLVRPWEIAQGHVDHALAFGYDSPSALFRAPASKSDGGNFGGVSGTDLPEGARIQLDPAKTDSDFNGIGLNASAKIVAIALQQYGMYCIDHSGSSKVYIEADETATWGAEVTTSFLSAIPWSWFRVIT